ncbi:hypothetical protein [Streptomyces pseudogriseolus]|uniref:hypothetical protein n=1 Tax=Streptomyces pseudogriseolus TaxID=36817 RepID=UPI003FA25514
MTDHVTDHIARVLIPPQNAFVACIACTVIGRHTRSTARPDSLPSCADRVEDAVQLRGSDPAGTVVDRDRTYWPATKQWTYKLTTEDDAGKRTTFKVKRHDYNNCFRNSRYPKCTTR